MLFPNYRLYFIGSNDYNNYSKSMNQLSGSRAAEISRGNERNYRHSLDNLDDYPESPYPGIESYLLFVLFICSLHSLRDSQVSIFV